MSLKIYYLDDEIDLLEIFSETFSAHNIEIKTFSDPEKLKKAVLEVEPDLIFIDYRLPSTTGDRVAKELPQHIPKALITGDMNIADNDLFISILSKPYKPDLIQKVISECKSRK